MPTFASASELPVDTAVGEYRVTGRLGEGGMGVVYSGVHPVLQRKVAIKVLNDEYARSDEASRRFVEEARSASQVRHRNIVDVFSFGQLGDGRYYQVMELLEGESLGRLLARKRVLPPEVAGPIVCGVLEGLEAAHKKGVIHRDLKPDNIFVSDERGAPEVKILDFGLAKRAGRESISALKSRTGVPMGTPAYMSPEQCRALGDVDHRADLYSVGVILYQLLLGKLPFSADSVFDLMMLHISEPVPSPAVQAGMPEALDAVIVRALSKAPAERFSSAAQMRAAVEAAATLARGWRAEPPSLDVTRRHLSPTAFTATQPSGGATQPTLPQASQGSQVSQHTLPPVSHSSLGFHPKSGTWVGVTIALTAIAVAAFVLLRPRPQPAPLALRTPVPAALLPAQRPAEGALRIEVVPPARVVLDGKLVGEGASVLISEVAAGSHELHAEADGHLSWDKSLTLVAGETRSFEVSLKPAPRQRPPSGLARPRPTHRRDEPSGAVDTTIDPYAR